jgi:hypothetical protein
MIKPHFNVALSNTFDDKCSVITGCREVKRVFI